MQRIWHLGQHGLIFAAAKSSVLIAPLLAAAMLSQSLYGTVEWWLALSMSIGPVVGMGAPTIVAYGSVGRRLYRHVRTATISVLLMALGLVVFALAMPIVGQGWLQSFYGPVALQCAVIILQMTLSARLKGIGKGAWASVAESTLYICLLGALLLTLLGADFVLSFMLCMLFVCVLLATGIFRLVHIPSVRRWPLRNFRACFHVGLRFMTGAALMGVFMATPRISLGFLASPEVVASFALVFRWLSISIVAHQFINTVFFRHIYGDVAERQRDRALALTVAVVALSALGIVVFLRFGPTLLPIPLPIPKDLGLALPIAAAMVMWATTACLEGSLFREGASSAQARAVTFGLTAQLVALAVFSAVFSNLVYGVTYAWLIGLVALIFFQWWILRARGRKMTNLIRTLLISILSLLAVMVAQI